MVNLGKKLVLNLLNSNGVNEEYLEDMGGIESGSEEWMEILSELLDKDVYEEEFSDEDDEIVKEFMSYLEDEFGIELV